MYKKLLFSSILALNAIAFPSINSANSLDRAQTKLGCKANHAFVEDASVLVNRSQIEDFLHFEVTNSRILTRFAPLDLRQNPIAIEDLAKVMGYDDLHWVNYVETDPYGIDDYRGVPVVTPYSDPPPGGYQYDAADRYPFYWDLDRCHNCHNRHHYQHPLVRDKYVMTFEDSPTDYRLQPGETIDFVTHLVGVKASKSSQDEVSWEIITSFSWELTNTVQGKSQISLRETDVLSESFSPQLQSQITQDGGSLSSFTIANQNKHNLRNHQCQLQSHQSQHLVDSL